ncbi:hypothetical protein ACWC98_11265 [Streptomyces goshikiensis]
MPLTDAERARQVLASLQETARACQSKVTATDQRYIGDFAREVSENLPGQWNVRVENYALPAWQDDLLSGLWATGRILFQLQHGRVSAAGILQGETGAELAIIHDPRHSVYRIGMLAPRDMYLDETVTPPTSITVHPAAVPAARKITSGLLADYHRAVFEMQLNHVLDDLAWAQEEFEPGTIQDPPQQDLAEAFGRFAAIAPHIITALRSNGADAFNAHEKAFLDDMDAVFGEPGPTPEIPSLSLLGMWLNNGEGLVDLARAAARTASAQAALGLVRAVNAPRVLPSPPPQIGASPSRR